MGGRENGEEGGGRRGEQVGGEEGRGEERRGAERLCRREGREGERERGGERWGESGDEESARLSPRAANTQCGAVRKLHTFGRVQLPLPHPILSFVRGVEGMRRVDGGDVGGAEGVERGSGTLLEPIVSMGSFGEDLRQRGEDGGREGSGRGDDREGENGLARASWRREFGAIAARS